MPAHLRLAPAAPHLQPSPESAPIRIVLADAHAVMRRSLRLLLDSEEGMWVIAEASDLAGAVRLVNGDAPHVVVLDMGLGDQPGLETIRRLRASAPQTGVVALTMEDDAVFARHALEAGASGFVLKDKADADLIAAIRAAANGEWFVSPQLASALRRGMLGA